MKGHTAERQDFLDCAHGLMILYMMFFHLCVSTIYGTPIYNIVTRPLSFFMAWFFFKSGMFYRERNIGEVVKIGLKRLITPAIIFSIIGFACYLMMEKPGINPSDELGFLYVFGVIRGNSPIWFLISLFAIQLLFAVLKKCKLSPYIIAIFSICLFFLNKQIGFRPFWTLNIPVGLLFYSLGYIFKDLQYNKIIIIISLFIYSGSFFFRVENVFAFGRFSPFFVVILSSLAGCILLNATFKSFPCLCIAPLRFFGLHAMEFYCTHMIIICFTEYILRQSIIHINGIIFEFTAFTLYLILFSIIILFLKMKRMQWVFGRSNL